MADENINKRPKRKNAGKNIAKLIQNEQDLEESSQDELDLLIEDIDTPNTSTGNLKKSNNESRNTAGTQTFDHTSQKYVSLDMFDTFYEDYIEFKHYINDLFQNNLKNNLQDNNSNGNENSN